MAAAWRARRGQRPAARRGRAAVGLRAGIALLAVLCLAGLGLLPTSLAAFSATASGPASSFTARATFGLTQTASPQCFSDDGSAGCTMATGIVEGQAVAVSPDGKNVYAGSSTSNAVAEFSRNTTTGSLTQLTTTNNKCVSNAGITGCTTVTGALNGVYDVVVSPDGKNLYAVASRSSTVAAFNRDTSTGALTPLANPNRCLYDTGATNVPNCSSARGIGGADGVAISPDGAFVYVSSYSTNSVAAFARDSATGVLTQLSGTAGCTSATGANGCATGYGLGQPYFMRMTPDGTSLYVASYASYSVAVFQRNPTTGVLTQPGGSNACMNDVSKGAVTGCTTASGLYGAYNVAIAPNGRTVYVMGYDHDTVAIFTRNTTTGVLTQAASVCLYLSGGTTVAGCSSARAINGPTGMTFSADGLFAFVSAYGSNGVAAFRHDNATGALTQLTGTSGCISVNTSGCSAGSGLRLANNITTSPDGRDVYVTGGNTQGNGAGYVASLNLTH
ncbi:lactonase family protein [Krasilnikovia sp. MM14-A1259]|uniref:lactonase family protein n=1 Tax=Krasilnikovia sp. MM14-A1259 TaxID=3373539 RepID=UPI0037F317CE